jgi:MFS family permease
MVSSFKKDIRTLFITRIVRMFAYGFLSVVLALYLTEVNLSAASIGVLFTVTLAGDAGITLWLTANADRLGRRRMLMAGTLLMIFAGAGFLLTRDPWLLAIAAIFGVLSPSGNEIGPFLSIEQASLSQLIADETRTKVFAWYNLVGSFATATGALCGGWLAQGLQTQAGWTALDAYRLVLAGYVAAGVLLFISFAQLGKEVEAPVSSGNTGVKAGLHKSRAVVLKLSGLFALDAFAGGLIVQSMFALWFKMRWGLDSGVIGTIFFGANVLAGFSALLAVPMAKKFGLINTMVFTHIPSNVLLILIPLMPTMPLAIVMLLLRFSISQMDVPTRQSYTMAVVDPDERSAAAGFTSIARSVGAMLSPSLAGVFLGVPGLISMPFFLCGGIKIVYDLSLWRAFSTVKPPEENA